MRSPRRPLEEQPTASVDLVLPALPEPIPQPPNLPDLLEDRWAEQRASEVVAAGQPGDDQPEKTPLNAELELRATHDQAQAMTGAWHLGGQAALDGEIASATEQVARGRAETDEAQQEHDTAAEVVRAKREEVHTTDGSAFLKVLGVAAGVVALGLICADAPLIQPVAAEVANLMAGTKPAYAAAFVVAAVQGLVAYLAGYFAKEWVHSSAPALVRRSVGIACGVLVLVALVMAVGLVALRMIQYEADVADPSGWDQVAAALTFVGVQFSLVGSAMGAAWIGHSPLLRQLRGLEASQEEAAEVFEASAQRLDESLRALEELERFRDEFDGWVAHHREAIQRSAEQMDNRFRSLVELGYADVPEGEIRVWKLAQVARPVFVVPVQESELSEDDLLDSPPPLQLI